MIDATDNSSEPQGMLRQPQVVFGRCHVTGEWGKVVALDPGDICLQIPDTERGVEYDPETEGVKFTFFKPFVIHTQLTLSEEGLQKLLDYSKDQENPIPALSPDLMYKWTALYKDGSALSQFKINGNDEVEEVDSTSIDPEQVAQISLEGHLKENLPKYTYVIESGKFYRDGVELDVGYPGKHPSGAPFYYRRRVTGTWGGVIPQGGMSRSMSTHTSVVQLLGWAENPDGGADKGACCIIGIDEMGNWRHEELR